MNPVLFDLETRSQADLRQVGGRRYAADPSTRVLTAVFLIDGVFHVWLPLYRDAVIIPAFADLWPAGFEPREPFLVWGGPVLPESVRHAVRVGRTFAAHNCAEFDAHVWREKIRPVPTRFYDTIHAARAAGLPGRLDELGQRFFGRGKDAGHSIMKKLMTLDSNGVNKHTLPGNVAAVARYNLADVIILRRVYEETRGYAEPEVVAAHEAINQRGVQFDSELARTIVDLGTRATKRAAAEIERITAGALKPEDLTKRNKVLAWLRSRGVPLGNLRKTTVDQLLDDPEAFVAALLESEDDAA